MPEEIKDTRELRLGDNEVLRRDLGFTSVDDMITFLEGDRFMPYFICYADTWIWPQQAEAYETGGSRRRGPLLEKS